MIRGPQLPLSCSLDTITVEETTAAEDTTLHRKAGGKLWHLEEKSTLHPNRQASV